MKIKIDLAGNPIKPQPKCKHCGKEKGQHLARTFNCPFGRGNFPQYFSNQFFEAKVPNV